MAGGKLSPRQRMINMMYLVLTALLALNVTKEVINAFVTINESVQLSKDNVDKKNLETYAAFQRAMSIDPIKYKDVNDKALSTKKAADDLVKFIDDTKKELIVKTEEIKAGEPVPELRDVERKDNFDVATNIMCGESQDGTGAKASELKSKIAAFKTQLLKNVPVGTEASYKKILDQLLNTDDPKKVEDGKRTWEMFSFYHNPIVATVALLTKFQSDVRNSEAQVIDNLLTSVDKTTIILNTLNAKVIQNSSVVTIGSDYEADVFLAATSSTLKPEVFIGATFDSAKKQMNGGNNQPLEVDANGFAKYKAHPGSEGEQKWGGVIRMKNPQGDYQYFPFQQSYVAQKPTSTVSADKMNVLYIGVDNPMSISVPGVANDAVKVSSEGGGISLKPDAKLGKGHYIATVTTVGQSTIKVTADFSGKSTPMGSFIYRVKRVPDPVAMVAQKKGGPINKGTLGAQQGVIPIMENFDFELFPKITSFKITIARRGGDPLEIESQSNLITDRMKTEFAKLHPNDKVYFEYIKAQMPNGEVRNLSSVNFVIQ